MIAPAVIIDIDKASVLVNLSFRKITDRIVLNIVVIAVQHDSII